MITSNFRKFVYRISDKGAIFPVIFIGWFTEESLKLFFLLKLGI